MHPLIRSLLFRLFPVGAIMFFAGIAMPAAAQVGSCGSADISESTKTAVENVVQSSGAGFSSFTCQNVGSVSENKRAQFCVRGLCAGGANIMCCAPGTGGTEGSAQAQAAATAAEQQGGFLRLQIPSACLSSGNCTLDDIIRTGVSFANLLFGISGAVLLATFVYGGVLYLTAGSSGNVSKAKDMIKNALIGMVLVFGAGLLVSTVYDTFRADTGGGVDACTTQKPGYSCQILQASPTDAAAVQAEMQSRGCIPNLCAGDTSRRCCPEAGGAQ